MNKKRFCLSLCLAMLCSIKIAAIDIYHVEIADGNILYFMDCTTLEFQREVEVINSGYVYSGELTIPDTIAVPDYNNPNKYVKAAVVGIYDYAFRHEDKLTRVNFPKTLRYIRPNAFEMCASLDSLILPESLQELNQEAFKYCYGLTYAKISAQLVTDDAFSDCPKLEEVVFTNHVNTVYGAFTNCNNIKRVILEDGPGEIFFSYSGTTNNKKAVFYESSLDSVYAGCGYDYEIYPFPGVKRPVLGPKATVIPRAYYQGDSQAEIIIPEGIRKINREAFQDAMVSNIIFPSTLNQIGSSAFARCRNLTELDFSMLPSNLQIDNGVFSECSNLSRVRFPEGFLRINDTLFKGCTSLEYINIPSSVTAIGSEAFYGCIGLSQLEMPSSLISIGNKAFTECTNLKDIDLPSSLKDIGRYAFKGCSKIENIVIPNTVDSLGHYAFEECNIKTVTLSSNLSVLHEGLFKNCSYLQSIIVPSKVYSIEKCVFQGCSLLDTITLPNSLSTISESLFDGCSNLKHITLPSGIRSIQNYSFRNCVSLLSVDIPYGATRIGKFAFYNNIKLNNVTLPNTITYIDDSAFGRCESLESFIFPNSIEKFGIRLGVLNGCTNLKEVILPEPDNEVRLYELNSTFSGCSSLQRIHIPKSVFSMSGCFDGCTSLSVVHFDESEDNISCPIESSTAFSLFKDCPLDTVYIGRNFNTNGTFFVSLTDYTRSPFYNKQIKYLSIEGKATNVKRFLFPNCKINKIQLGELVSSIEEYAFYNTIPDTIVNLRETPAAIDNTSLARSRVEVPTGSGLAYRENAIWSKNLIIDDSDTLNTVNVKYPGTLIASMKQQGISIPRNVTQLKIEGNLNLDDWDVLKEELPYYYYLDISSIEIDSIPSNQFKDNYRLVDIKLPNSISRVGDHAFYGCNNLRNEQITLPSCDYVGENAFANSNISDLIFTKDVTISPNAFNNSDLKSVRFLSSVNINNNAFYNCKKLSQVGIYGEECSIDSASFYNCNNLKTFLQPTLIRNIGAYAFYNCSSLESFNLPELGSDVGRHAFDGCTSLEHITIPGTNHFIGDFAFANSGLQRLTIRNGISSFGEYVFRNCTNLSGKIVLPASMTHISKGMFMNCTALDTIALSDKIVKIKTEAFKGCSRLSNINLPLSLTTIEPKAFENCESLNEVELPKWLSYFDGAFYNCNLKQITTHWQIPVLISGETFSGVDVDQCILKVPANSTPYYLTTSVWKVFWRVEEDEHELIDKLDFSDAEFKRLCLTKWDVNKDEEIGVDEMLRAKSLDGLFNNNYQIQTSNDLLYFKNLERIGENDFSSCINLKSISIPENVVKISPRAFDYCPNLTHIDIVEGNTIYDSRENCNAIIETKANKILRGTASTKIPASITCLHDSAFYQCTGLNMVVLPENVTQIGNDSFNGCTNLKKIIIGKGLNSIGENAFKDCFIDTVTINNELLLESHVYNESNIRKVLGSHIKQVTLGDEVKNLPSYAFSACEELKVINFPQHLSTIGGDAFRDCTSLKEIILPHSLEELGGGCFKGCTNLKDVVLPSNLSKISYEMFKGCTSLERITIPSSVLSIDGFAFNACTALSDVVLPSQLVSIGSSAFGDCTALTDVGFSDQLVSIGSLAFKGCTALKSLVLQENVQTIGSGAFLDCKNLETVFIPSTVISIGDNAFRSCSNVKELHVFWDNPTDISLKGLNYSNINLYVPKDTKATYLNTHFNACAHVWEPAIMGDINDDGEVNVSDVTGQVNLILDYNTADLRSDAADVNHDGIIRVDDLTDLLTMILDDDSPIEARAVFEHSNRAKGNDILSFISENNIIKIHFDKNVQSYSNMQFDITLPTGFSLTGIHHDTHEVLWKKRSDGAIRVITYSMNNAPLAKGPISIKLLGDNSESHSSVIISNIILSTDNATSEHINDMHVKIESEATSIRTNLSNVESKKNKVYSLNGQYIKQISSQEEVKTLPKGIYVINGHKIIIK